MHTAIVTGGTGTLGRVVASALMNNGMRVAIPFRPGSRGEPLPPPGDDGALFLRESDISTESGASAFVREAAEKFGGVGILVNCATVWATLPSSARGMPVRPWLAMTIKFTSKLCARSTMVSA